MQIQVPSITISDPAKLKVIAVPIRQQILGAFAQPNTPQGAAKKLGMEGKGIYRHIDLLLEHGFLFVVDTSQKRGATERTLQTSARRYVGEVGDPASDEIVWRDFIAPMQEAYARTGARPRLLRATVKIKEEDLADFEAAFLDLVREYDLGEGKPLFIQLASFEPPPED